MQVHDEKMESEALREVGFSLSLVPPVHMLMFDLVHFELVRIPCHRRALFLERGVLCTSQTYKYNGFSDTADYKLTGDFQLCLAPDAWQNMSCVDYCVSPLFWFPKPLFRSKVWAQNDTKSLGGILIAHRCNAPKH